MSKKPKPGRRLFAIFAVLVLLFPFLTGLSPAPASAAMTADALEALLGAPGFLAGPLPEMVGVAGPYDPELFTASADEVFPGIRLTLNDTPDAFIVISSPPYLRYHQMISGFYADEEDAYLAVPHLIASRSQLVPHRSVAAAVDIVEESDYGPTEVAYDINYVGRYTSARDIISLSDAGHAIIHIEYPYEDEATLAVLKEGVSQLWLPRALRPITPFGIKDNNKLDTVQSVDDIIAYLEEFPIYFNEEGDLRVNAELVMQAYTAAYVDAIFISHNMMTSRADDGDLAANERIVSDFAKLEPYGFTNEFVMDEAGRLSEHIVSVETGRFFEQYLDHLPESYIDPLLYLRDHERYLYPKADFVTSEEWLNYVMAATELALLVGDDPTWHDPIWTRYHETVANVFDVFLYNHRTADGELNEPAIQAYHDYLAEAERLAAALPEGYFARHLGPYPGYVESMLELIEQNGGKALDEDDLKQVMSDFDVYNLTPFHTTEG